MVRDYTFTAQIDGKDMKCTALYTFRSEITQADYLLYTPDDPADPEARVLAGRFDGRNFATVCPLCGKADRTITRRFYKYAKSVGLHPLSHCPDVPAASADELYDETDDDFTAFLQ